MITPKSLIDGNGHAASIEIRPSGRWVLIALAAAAVWWIMILPVGVLGWPHADWILQAFIVWLFLLSALATAAVDLRWNTLSLIADANEIRFGKRVLPRADVAAISTGPVAATAVQFWLTVLVMAITQDLSKRVYFRAFDGRVLFETSNLYGSDQLARLAAFLGIPFVDSYRGVDRPERPRRM